MDQKLFLCIARHRLSPDLNVAKKCISIKEIIFVISKFRKNITYVTKLLKIRKNHVFIDRHKGFLSDINMRMISMIIRYYITFWDITQQFHWKPKLFQCQKYTLKYVTLFKSVRLVLRSLPWSLLSIRVAGCF